MVDKFTLYPLEVHYTSNHMQSEDLDQHISTGTAMRTGEKE